MINEITTVFTYALDGATTFLVPFEYLARKYVSVTLIGKDRKRLYLNTDYTFLTKNQIVTNKVWTQADGYTLIEIRRYTSATEKLVSFTDGTVLRSDDLNLSQIQILHIAAEARDLSADTIGTNNEGNLDARGRRICNVADPQLPGDAVSFGLIQKYDNSALHSAERAKEAADRSVAASLHSQGECDRAYREADRSRDEANRSRNEADRSAGFANTAGNHAANAQNLANQVASQVSNATDAANRARESSAEAKRAEDGSNYWQAQSKEHADRAKREADKLGNNNALASTIDHIEGGSGDYGGAIYWRAHHVSPEIVASHKLNFGYGWNGKGAPPTLDFSYGSNVWCGNLVTSSDKRLTFSGMPEIRMNCDLNVGHIVTKYHNVNGGWKLNSGEFRNRSGDYLKADVRTSYNNNTYFLTHGMQLSNGMGNENQSSWYFLEDNGKRVAQVIKVMDKQATGDFVFGTDGFTVYAPRILLEAYNQTTILHPDGNIQSTSGLWDGGYLKVHIDRQRDALNKRIDDSITHANDLNASINVRLNGLINRMSNLEKKVAALEAAISNKSLVTDVYLSPSQIKPLGAVLKNGEVMVGLDEYKRYLARTIMIKRSDGTTTAAVSE